ncbi:MAG: OmpA family protein [Thermodesulfobacteriota bacterium]|nr:OmpA family protein [Thermodesulfobacteriota bacterium]
MRKVLFPAIAVLLFAVSAEARHSHYLAAVAESEWTVDTSRLICSLEHSIPYFGEASFSCEAGGRLSLEIRTFLELDRQGIARIFSIYPDWNNNPEKREMGTIHVYSGKVPFRFDTSLARLFLDELEQGMSPTITLPDTEKDIRHISVSLSPVKFMGPYAEFLDCLKCLISYGFSQLNGSSVFFDTNSNSLKPHALQHLDRLADYMKAAQGSILTISGHTDNTGTGKHNLGLSKRRAEAVRDYLMDNGLSGERIKNEFFGDTRPYVPNVTPQGRSKNRRVTLKISRNH